MYQHPPTATRTSVSSEIPSHHLLRQRFCGAYEHRSSCGGIFAGSQPVEARGACAATQRTRCSTPCSIASHGRRRLPETPVCTRPWIVWTAVPCATCGSGHSRGVSPIQRPQSPRLGVSLSRYSRPFWMIGQSNTTRRATTSRLSCDWDRRITPSRSSKLSLAPRRLSCESSGRFVTGSPTPTHLAVVTTNRRLGTPPLQ